jgi:TonB family protein
VVDPEAARNPPPSAAPGPAPEPDPDANPVSEAAADEPARCPALREIPITDDAANAGITSGRVVIEVVVGSQGGVLEARLVEGTGYEIDQVALAEVKKLRCTAAKVGGKSVAQKRKRIEIPIEL